MKQVDIPESFSLREIAKRSPIPRSETALRVAIKSRRLKASLVNGKYFITLRDLEEYFVAGVMRKRSS